MTICKIRTGEINKTKHAHMMTFQAAIKSNSLKNNE